MIIPPPPEPTPDRVSRVHEITLKNEITAHIDLDNIVIVELPTVIQYSGDVIMQIYLKSHKEPYKVKMISDNETVTSEDILKQFKEEIYYPLIKAWKARGI